MKTALDVQIRWRAPVTDEEVVLLTESYGGRSAAGWWDQIRSHSLGWVTARLVTGALVGFVNVAWDGADHAFLLDPKTHHQYQRQGIATEMVALAVEASRQAGCEWLHVDFEAELRPFYLGACQFKPPAGAGLIHLYDPD